MTLDEMFAICRVRCPNQAEIVTLCESVASDRAQALDSVALSVARRYLSGEVAFETADTLINGLWAHAVATAADGDRLPPLLDGIYDAFDSGESRHPGDPPGTNPELKYTRPLLERVLTSSGAV